MKAAKVSQKLELNKPILKYVSKDNSLISLGSVFETKEEQTSIKVPPEEEGARTSVNFLTIYNPLEQFRIAV